MKKELSKLFNQIKILDSKVITIFISIAILQTISYYYTSRRFFRNNFYEYFYESSLDVNLLEFFYWFITDTFILLVIPIIIILVIFREKLKDYGLCFGEAKGGLKFSIIAITVMIPIIWIISASPDFAKQYPLLKNASESWLVFILYQLGVLLFLIAWEFIWRGYMLFGLEKKFGVYAILIQMLPFVILHNGKPALETFSAILGGLALGILAYNTRSIFYGVIVHFGVMFTIDLFSVLRIKAENYEIGIEGIIKVIGKLF